MSDTTADLSRDESMLIAEEILSQIPQMTKWELGIERRVALDKGRGGLELHLGGMLETRGKRVEIVVNSGDLYDIRVYRMVKRAPMVLATASGIFCDDMAEVVRDLVFNVSEKAA
jgi:hypothetical protein